MVKQKTPVPKAKSPSVEAEATSTGGPIKRRSVAEESVPKRRRSLRSASSAAATRSGSQQATRNQAEADDNTDMRADGGLSSVLLKAPPQSPFVVRRSTPAVSEVPATAVHEAPCSPVFAKKVSQKKKASSQQDAAARVALQDRNSALPHRGGDKKGGDKTTAARLRTRARAAAAEGAGNGEDPECHVQ